MRKVLFKKILSILDYIEIKSIGLKKAITETEDRLQQEGYRLQRKEIEKLFNLLIKFHYLKQTKHGIDLSPVATILCKSNQGSDVEALAIFECIIQYKEYFDFMEQWINNNEAYHKVDLYNEMDEHSVQLLCSSTLVDVKDDEYFKLHVSYLPLMKQILEEIREGKAYLSLTLGALFARSIVNQKDHGDYKNIDEPMIAYPHKKELLKIIPKRGIPKSRDETKSLQSFYKDTLFHEFEHCCPLCGIDLPYMLIASHIKPFRDCAHIYEAIDHNNGILLCRNHDFLFDQGYFTFDDNGYIILSNELLEKEDLLQSYALSKNTRLDPRFLTIERRLFLEYHRKHIFQK